MLLTFRRAIFTGYRILLAHVSAALRRSVAFATGEMIDLRRQVDPNHGVRRATTLYRGFVRELPRF